MTSTHAPVLPQPIHVVGHSFFMAGAIILVIGGLYFGREFFIPFALAILLAFALSPLVNQLKLWRIPHAAAVLLAVAFAFAIIASLSYVVTTHAIKLAEAIPGYQQTMTTKIRSIRDSSAGRGGLLDRLTTTVEGLSREVSGTEEAPGPKVSKPGAAPAPSPPAVSDAEAKSPLALLRTAAGPLMGLLGTAGIVIVFLFFILLERDDMRDRFIKLAGAGDLQTSTEALNEAGSRVSRYLLMQLVVNVSYGLPIGLGLYVIGIPNAVLWGVLAAVLRFIPFLGPFLAAIFPLVLAFAVDPGWSMLVWVIALFLVTELLSNNVLEPWLYGASTGLSSFAIISGAILWTTLWGPVGLVLATPLTVCLIVIGRYVPQLQFLGVLLGTDPVLKPEEQLYQRLLGGNTEQAVEIAESYVDEHSHREFYDQVAIPALRLAENDRQRNMGDTNYKRTISEGMIAVVREVAGHLDQRRKNENIDHSERVPRALGKPDLCIGGRTDLDCAAAEMVAQVVAGGGITSRVLPPIAISQNGIGQLDLAGVEVVCLSYLAPEPQTFARFVCRRLKRRAAHIKTIVCLWNPSAALLQSADLKDQLGADAVVFSVGDAAAQIDAWVAPHMSDPMQAAPIPGNEVDRLAALRNLQLTSGQGKYFDEVAAKVASAFQTPIALVTLIEEDHQHWPGAVGLAPKLDACRMSTRETSICGHVVAANELLVIEDTAKDPRFANNPFLIENGIRFYAGTPLRTREGFAIGSLCIIDTNPRSFTHDDRQILAKIADDLMVKVEIEHARLRHLLGQGLDGKIPEHMNELLGKLSFIG